MIRTTVVGSWPPAPQFAEPLQRYHKGELTLEEAEPLLRAVAAVAIEQQKQCGLDEYTGGETAADSFILHFSKVLTGIAPTTDQAAWDGRGTYQITGPLSAPQGLGIAAAFRREKTLDPAIPKVTLPGPSEITMMIEPAEARMALWPTVIELIRAKMRECIALGARDIQLDLPHVAMSLVDHEKPWTPENTAALLQTIFAGMHGIRRSLHFCYGDFGAQTWTQNRNFHALLPTLQKLAGVIDRTVLEFSLPEQWAERELLREIPESIEIAAGIVDVKAPTVQTVTELQAKITELLNYVPAQRLLICPSCGLGRRNVELAIHKVTAMVQAAHTL